MDISNAVETGDYTIKLTAAETKTLRDVLDGLTDSSVYPFIGNEFDFCADLLVSIGGPLR